MGSFSFLVVGDWGRQGKQHQGAVAAGLASLASLHAFVVSTGDNVYPRGLTSADDPRWEHTFSDVYSHPALLPLPWMAVLGNHDWYGKVSAQWGVCDARWHAAMSFSDGAAARSDHGSFRGAPLVSLFYVDTSPWIEEYRAASEMDWFANGIKPHSQGVWDWAAWEQAQLDRLQRAMESSSARWKVVVGHHAIYSYAREHGSSVELARINGVLRRAGAAVYLNGHDHNLQVIQSPSQSNETEPLYVTSGAGSAVRDSVEDPGDGSLLFSYGQSGFNSVAVSSEALVVRSHDATGTLLHSVEVPWAPTPQCGTAALTQLDSRCELPLGMER